MKVTNTNHCLVNSTQTYKFEKSGYIEINNKIIHIDKGDTLKNLAEKIKKEHPLINACVRNDILYLNSNTKITIIDKDNLLNKTNNQSTNLPTNLENEPTLEDIILSVYTTEERQRYKKNCKDYEKNCSLNAALDIKKANERNAANVAQGGNVNINV